MKLVAPFALLLLALAGCGGDSDSSAVSNTDTGNTGEQEALCQPGERVTATVFVDGPGELVYGVHTRLYYPASVEIPGKRDKRTVSERIKFVVSRPNGSDGLPEEEYVNGATIVFDEDVDSDGIDDRIGMLLVSPTQPFPDGKFAAVTFDCVESIAWPTADTFPCEVPEVTDLNLTAASATCHVEVAPPPEG